MTINDDDRSDEMTKDKTRLYTAFRRYIEANPVYEPFARPFTSTHGRIHNCHRTPATRLGVGSATERIWLFSSIHGDCSQRR